MISLWQVHQLLLASFPLLTKVEAGALLGVHPDSVCRWAREGKLTRIRFPGCRRGKWAYGHVRFLRSEVLLLKAERAEVAA